MQFHQSAEEIMHSKNAMEASILCVFSSSNDETGQFLSLFAQKDQVIGSN